MGFSVTAAHAIFLVALLAAGSAASGAYWTVSRDLDEARRLQADRVGSFAQTNLTIMDAPSYDEIAGAYDFQAYNDGSVALRVVEVVFIVDGRYNDAILSRSVDGDATTGLWLPGETLAVSLSVTSEPSYLKVVAGNGASAYYRR